MPYDHQWDIHKDDPNWPYDEEGFLKGVRRHAFTSSFMSAMDQMTGEKPPIRIESDYSEEFRLAALSVLGNRQHFVMVKTDINHDGTIIFDYAIDDWRQSYGVSRHVVRDGTRDDFAQIRRVMYRQVIERYQSDTTPAPATDGDGTGRATGEARMTTDWSEYAKRLEGAANLEISQVAVFNHALSARQILDLIAPPTYKVRYFLLWRITDKYRLGEFVSRKWQWRWN